jgi:hypothetical protein
MIEKTSYLNSKKSILLTEVVYKTPLNYITVVTAEPATSHP